MVEVECKGLDINCRLTKWFQDNNGELYGRPYIIGQGCLGHNAEWVSVGKRCRDHVGEHSAPAAEAERLKRQHEFKVERHEAAKRWYFAQYGKHLPPGKLDDHNEAGKPRDFDIRKGPQGKPGIVIQVPGLSSPGSSSDSSGPAQAAHDESVSIGSSDSLSFHNPC